MPFRALPGQLVMPILTGRLRGRRWVVGAGQHRCWVGAYEPAKQRLFAQGIRPGDTVYDIGAHAGFFTLLASELVGPAGLVVAFEPSATNLAHLTRHLHLNGLTNVTAMPAAVLDHGGTGAFVTATDSYTGHVGSTGAPVQLVAIDELCAGGAIPDAACIKIDVEGAEHRVLLGARSLLARARPTVFVATHGPQQDGDCRRLLESLGYSVEAFEPGELVARHSTPAS
jgi:FkbM family methyltransferase